MYVPTNTYGLFRQLHGILYKLDYKPNAAPNISMANAKTKVHLTLSDETAEWLENHYPESDSQPEAVRAAIGDARRFWELVEVRVERE